MNDLVGPWVRRFLVEYVIGERNYSPNTSTATETLSGCSFPWPPSGADARWRT